MAYSTNPNLPKARAIALKLLLVEGVPAMVVARQCGIHRSTLCVGSRNGERSMSIVSSITLTDHHEQWGGVSLPSVDGIL